MKNKKKKDREKVKDREREEKERKKREALQKGSRPAEKEATNAYSFLFKCEIMCILLLILMREESRSE